MMRILVVEPEKTPYVKEIAGDLSSLQAEVGGSIEAIYPFNDPVALICNEEGKIIGMPLNRAMRDEDGNVWDIISGTFLITGLSDGNFTSLSDELIDIYHRRFQTPEYFFKVNGKTLVIPF